MQPSWHHSRLPDITNLTNFPSREESANSVREKKERLLRLLHVVVPPNSSSFLTAESWRNIQIHRNGHYEAKIDHDDSMHQNDVRWIVRNQDPTVLTEIENLIHELHNTDVGNRPQTASTHRGMQSPTANELTRNAFSRDRIAAENATGVIVTENFPAATLAAPSSSALLRVSYSPSGFSTRSVTSFEEYELVSESGTRYSLNIYIDPHTRDRLQLHTGSEFSAGASGTIHLARSESGSLVALKKFAAEEQARNEFENHLKLGDGDHFIKVYDLVVEDSAPYIAMELVLGTSEEVFLKNLINNVTISNAEKKKTLVSALNNDLKALYAIHARGFEHGDIHFGNFLHEDLNDYSYICDLERMTELSAHTVLGEYMGMAYEIGKIADRAQLKGIDVRELQDIISSLNSGEANFRSPKFIPTDEE